MARTVVLWMQSCIYFLFVYVRLCLWLPSSVLAQFGSQVSVQQLGDDSVTRVDSESNSFLSAVLGSRPRLPCKDPTKSLQHPNGYQLALFFGIRCPFFWFFSPLNFCIFPYYTVLSCHVCIHPWHIPLHLPGWYLHRSNSVPQTNLMQMWAGKKKKKLLSAFRCWEVTHRFHIFRR